MTRYRYLVHYAPKLSRRCNSLLPASMREGEQCFWQASLGMKHLISYVKQVNPKAAKRWLNGDLRYCEGACTWQEDSETFVMFHGFLFDRKKKLVIDPLKPNFKNQQWKWLIMRSWNFAELSRFIKNSKDPYAGGLPISSGIDSLGGAINPDGWEDIEAQVYYDPPFAFGL